MSGPGIDYGLGKTNIDEATGIRYGIISRHSVMPEALDDIYAIGDDLSFQQAKSELLAHLTAALYQVLSSYQLSKERAKDIAESAAENLVDDIGGDCICEIDNPVYQYERDGYVLRTCSDNDLFVLKSPFYTYARYCSPCVPGAGNLDDAVDVDVSNTAPAELELSKSGVKTYCLDSSWFEGGKAPYPIFRVKK